MVFEILMESVNRGELILIDGGYCRYHLKANGCLTIYEIIATKSGAGSEILEILKSKPMVMYIVAECPDDLLSNKWWIKKGFQLNGSRILKSGRKINNYSLPIYKD